MKTTPIRDIPVKMICAGAGVSRSTFYSYYDSQYDLLREVEEETFAETENLFRPYLIEAKRSSRLKLTIILEHMLQFVADNSYFQVLLSENGDGAFQKQFFRKGIVELRRLMEAAGAPSQDEKASDYGFAFLVGGFQTFVQEWLKNSMDAPAPEMAKMIAWLIRDTLR
jgi:AcrR family transcriptional regulator